MSDDTIHTNRWLTRIARVARASHRLPGLRALCNATLKCWPRPTPTFYHIHICGNEYVPYSGLIDRHFSVVHISSQRATKIDPYLLLMFTVK